MPLGKTRMVMPAKIVRRAHRPHAILKCDENRSRASRRCGIRHDPRSSAPALHPARHPSRRGPASLLENRNGRSTKPNSGPRSVR